MELSSKLKTPLIVGGLVALVVASGALYGPAHMRHSKGDVRLD